MGQNPLVFTLENTGVRKRRGKITVAVESMPRKVTYEQALVAYGWVALDPADTGVIEKLFKKDIREGEEKLMLAVLASAIEHFQKHVLSKDEKGRELFQEAEEWFLEKDSDQLFSFEYICETLGLHPDYLRQGLLSWKEAKRNELSVQRHRGGRKTLVKTRGAHTLG
jgi:hypothetical protein